MKFQPVVKGHHDNNILTHDDSYSCNDMTVENYNENHNVDVEHFSSLLLTPEGIHQQQNNYEIPPTSTFQNNQHIINNNNNNNTPSNTNKASLLSCIINLLNTLIGAGMLGLPKAFASAGIVPGTIILLVASYLSALGLRLLSISAMTTITKKTNMTILGSNNNNHLSSRVSFYSVAINALPQFATFIDASVAFKCFGVATGYFITVADCMVTSFQYIIHSYHTTTTTISSSIMTRFQHLLLQRTFWVIMSLILVLPISFFKTLDSLRFTSTLSLCLIYALSIGIVLYAQGVLNPCPDDNVLKNPYQEIIPPTDISTSSRIESSSCHGPIHYFTQDITSILRNLSIFIFSFTCHQNIFAVVNEIEDRTQNRLNKVIFYAIVPALLVYLVVALEGYSTFGDQVQGDILLNYPETGIVTMMRISIAIMVLLSYPLQLDPSRRCLMSLITALKQKQFKATVVENERGSVENDTIAATEEKLIDDVTNPFHTVNRTKTQVNEEDIIDNSLRKPLLDNTMEQNEFSDENEEGEEDNDNIIQPTDENSLFTTITCVFLLLSFLIALFVTDLGVILSIVGATGSTMVSYILPGAIYIQLHPKFHGLKILAYIQLTLGIIIIPTTLYFILTDR